MSCSDLQRLRKLRGPQRPEAAGVILTAPGEEAQVDYGSGPMVRDPQSGKYRRTRLLVLTLGYSRKSVCLLAWRSSARTWAEPHEKAFRRLGDCLKAWKKRKHISTAGKSGVHGIHFFPPWFLPKHTLLKIEALLPYYYHIRFRVYFDCYGCVGCGRKDVIYVVADCASPVMD